MTAEALAKSQAAAPLGPRVHSRGEDLALLQYTSGSTGNPKGVMLTHANLLANVRAIGEALELRNDDVGVSWLPLYHDMGLIGAWLMPLYFGTTAGGAVAAGISLTAGAVAARAAPLSRHDRSGAEFCVRAGRRKNFRR